MINYPQSKVKTSELRLGGDSKYPLDGGLNLQSQESAIKISQSPYMLNMNSDDRGTLIKRWGQTYVYPTSLGAGGINGVYPSYKGYTIMAWGTKLYKQQGNSQPVEIYSGLANSKAFLFVFNGILYLINGSQYIQYDGTTVKTVEAYIPTATQGRKPNGTQSNLYEPLNLYGDWFKDSFSSDGTTDYILSMDVEAVGDVYVNGVKKTLTTDYTVTLPKTIKFTSAIPAGAPNNVIITAKKSNPEGKASILKCTRAVEFASRMWFTGNPEQPNKLWKTGLTDKLEADYFPASGFSSFETVGGIDEAITNFVPHYDKLVILKERSTWYTYAEQQSSGEFGFPIKRLNSQIGCDMPDTVQLINNNPCFCNTYGGVYIIVSTMLEGEKNVLPVSQNVNGIPYRPGLLQETNIKEASSHDDGRKYYICVGKKVWVWDYSASFDINHPENLKWYPYDFINAKQFFILNNETCYSDRDMGVLKKFVNVPNDFGLPINGVWRSALLDFGHPDYEKTISDIWLTTRANANASVKIKYYNDNGDLLDTIIVPQTATKSFSWSNFSWSSFTWAVQRYAPTIHKKIKLKKIRYFQIEISNNEYNENLSILSLVIKYSLTKKVK